MSALLLLLASVALAQRTELPRTRGVYHAAAYPTKPGVYRHKGWRYEYVVEARGTRSETHIGRLFLDDREIIGTHGELLEEFLGHFIYFDNASRDHGWLNTLSGDRPVFDEGGLPTPAARRALAETAKRPN